MHEPAVGRPEKIVKTTTHGFDEAKLPAAGAGPIAGNDSVTGTVAEQGHAWVAETGTDDFVGAFAVTAGIGIDERVAHFKKAHDDYNAILLKALADRLAEALAEYVHERVRVEHWAYAPDERLDNNALIAEQYRGIRPAPGYPACPDHTEKRTLFELLGCTERIGVSLTGSCAMTPASSVSGIYIAHPDSTYFGVAKVQADQVADYAARKGMSVTEVERWLAPVLDYDPAAQAAA